jgi:hypothetical protein
MGIDDDSRLFDEALIVECDDSFDDLIAASESTLQFWDNQFDDEDWNGVAAQASEMGYNHDIGRMAR